jgi:hypothetical protein
VPPEETFAGDPIAELLLRSGTNSVYRITGVLDPSTC